MARAHGTDPSLMGCWHMPKPPKGPKKPLQQCRTEWAWFSHLALEGNPRWS